MPSSGPRGAVGIHPDLVTPLATCEIGLRTWISCFWPHGRLSAIQPWRLSRTIALVILDIVRMEAPPLALRIIAATSQTRWRLPRRRC